MVFLTGQIERELLKSSVKMFIKIRIYVLAFVGARGFIQFDWHFLHIFCSSNRLYLFSLCIFLCISLWYFIVSILFHGHADVSTMRFADRAAMTFSASR